MAKINIEAIHNSLVNGQRRQMIKQIDEYGPADFFPDYSMWLGDIEMGRFAYKWFTDATVLKAGKPKY